MKSGAVNPVLACQVWARDRRFEIEKTPIKINLQSVIIRGRNK